MTGSSLPDRSLQQLVDRAIRDFNKSERGDCINYEDFREVCYCPCFIVLFLVPSPVYRCFWRKALALNKLSKYLCSSVYFAVWVASWTKLSKTSLETLVKIKFMIKKKPSDNRKTLFI